MVKTIYETNKYIYIMIELDHILFKRLPSIKFKANNSLYLSYKSYL